MSRTYWAVPLESVPAESIHGDCAARKAGYVCALTPGHSGPLHVSHGTESATVWNRAQAFSASQGSE